MGLLLGCMKGCVLGRFVGCIEGCLVVTVFYLIVLMGSMSVDTMVFFSMASLLATGRMKRFACRISI